MVIRNNYIPSLDGMRAVAFSIVFVSHVGLGSIVPGGFGVTVFFFLSGFLITSLLQREFVETGSISLRDFYLRRIIRIFPPLYISLATMIVMTRADLLPGSLRFMPIFSEAVFFTNYYSLYNPALTGAPAGSGVLWSLAVEEHFYLAFPLLLVATLRASNSMRVAAVVCGALCLFALGWRIFLVSVVGWSGDRTYVGTDTRIDLLLFGCILALVFRSSVKWAEGLQPRTRFLILLSSAGVLLLTFAYRNELFRSTLRYTI